MLGICKNFICCALLNKFAFIYYCHMAAYRFYNTDFMGDDENGNSKLFVDILEEFKDCLCCKGIQRGSGFVAKKN